MSGTPELTLWDGWQLIETAPTDGSPLRLFDPEYADEEMGTSFDGHWTDCREDGTAGFVAAVWNNCHDCFATVAVSPTHWMPQPATPVLFDDTTPETSVCAALQSIAADGSERDYVRRVATAALDTFAPAALRALDAVARGRA